MAEQGEITIDRVFEVLDGWRHLPDYQLERRTDIFFALFLPEVLQERFGLAQMPKLIPEFPIKKINNNQSTKVDYLALSDDRALLVELKTDMASKGEKQEKFLCCTAKRKLKQ